MSGHSDALRFALLAGLVLLLPGPAFSQTAEKREPGVVHGPGARGPIKRDGQPGYDHPNQYLGIHAKLIAENMEPVIEHPEQATEADNKLSELAQRKGKKPNIVVFLMDDVGWMDFGFNGGGIAVGSPTPDVDRIASEGLILTSAYSQPSCSPTRATILTITTAFFGRRCTESPAD